MTLPQASPYVWQRAAQTLRKYSVEHLMSERFIACYPSLAVKLQESNTKDHTSSGLDQAIVLQQLRFRLIGSDYNRDVNGMRWHGAKWSNWAEDLPFWSDRKIRRVFADLQSKGVILVKQTARFNYYAIDYAAYETVVLRGEQVLTEPGQADHPDDPRVVKLTTQPGQSDHPIEEEAKTEGRKESSTPKEPKRNLTRVVWGHYRQVMGVRREQMDDEEREIINKALATFSEAPDPAAVLCRAIDGCYASDFHMGRDRERNDKGTKYNKVSQILKGKRGGKTTREQIEMFLEYAESSSTSSGFPSADDATLRRRMQEAVAGRTNGDPSIAETGMEAEAWLAEHGLKTVVEERGEGVPPSVKFERMAPPAQAAA
jgi:hypothetical protein